MTKKSALEEGQRRTINGMKYLALNALRNKCTTDFAACSLMNTPECYCLKDDFPTRCEGVIWLTEANFILHRLTS